ncbi:Inhibin alpha chain [Chelonia mydas]|uniref:Inhibin alpha chain n=1 Tax=Chelonia mydas TaxID=8469 RepID=M7BBH3_CHEMY|nr:Inhibin alpha chain [Chelonia mydas]
MWLLHLLLALLAPVPAAGCQGAELDRQLVLAKLRAQILEYLSPSSRAQQERRGMHRRHIPGTPDRRGQELEDTSQVILFPTTDVPCEPPQPDELPEDESVFTYLFQPSAHTLSRVVTSTQLWFHTGPVVVVPPGSSAAANRSAGGPDVLLFVLLVRCPGCPCTAAADKMPFLMATTKPKGPDRARRASVPWSPAALNLLQRPSEDTAAHADCHRAALNISFEELGWDKWIVHPSSFVFHYCHGSCSDAHTLSHALGFRLCCAALPSTMRSLRVRTTSDGGYSFKYETVPNILTQDCACI